MYGEWNECSFTLNNTISDMIRYCNNKIEKHKLTVGVLYISIFFRSKFTHSWPIFFTSHTLFFFSCFFVMQTKEKLVHKPISNANISNVFAKLIVFYSEISFMAQMNFVHLHFHFQHCSFEHDDDWRIQKRKKIAPTVHNNWTWQN